MFGERSSSGGFSYSFQLLSEPLHHQYNHLHMSVVIVEVKLSPRFYRYLCGFIHQIHRFSNKYFYWVSVYIPHNHGILYSLSVFINIMKLFSVFSGDLISTSSSLKYDSDLIECFNLFPF